MKKLIKILIKILLYSFIAVFLGSFINYLLINRGYTFLAKYDVVNKVVYNPFWLTKDVSEMFPKGQIRDTADIIYIIVHHDSIPADRKNRIIDIYNYHKSKGWGTIAYHYYIMPSGLIYRLHGDNEITPHCKNENKKSIGICLNGDFENNSPTLNQYFSYNILSLYLSEKYNAEIKEHRDFSNTKCPGRNFKPIYRKHFLEWIKF